MSDALVSQGCLLEVAQAGSPSTFIAIGEVRSMSGPDGQRAKIDVTHLRSVAKEYKVGLPDRGRFTFEVNFLPGDAGQDRLRALELSGAEGEFRLSLSDVAPTTALFRAFVATFPLSMAQDGAIQGTVSLETTGDWTWSS